MSGVNGGSQQRALRPSVNLVQFVLHTVASVALALAIVVSAHAQGLTILPVTMELAPGQSATTLTVINQEASETSFQVRGYAWTQVDGSDQLEPTVDLLVSPPIGTIPANATQVVRIVLRHPAQGHEGTYRILLDQIPPATSPGTVRIALRLSIPVFAEPPTRATPHVQWRIEGNGGQAYLVATNDGGRHETVRNIELAGAIGRTVRVEPNLSPYILPGATRRWRILGLSSPTAGTTLRLTARTDNSTIDQAVTVVATP